MHRGRYLATSLLLLGLASISSARAGEAHVRFVAPERFTDASLSGDRRVDVNAPALQQLARHIERLAARGLQVGRTLEVEITDVDLVGRFEALRLEARDVRIVTSVTWPRIALRYRLRDGEKTIIAGEEEVRDQTFDMRPGRINSSDWLFSEKAMLDDWFSNRFTAR